MAQAVLAHTSSAIPGWGSAPLLSLRPPRLPQPAEAAGGAAGEGGRGFGGGAPTRRGGKGGAANRGAAGRGRKRRGSGFSAADRLPLGRSPDLEAIEARQRLGLSLAGRLREEEVNRAWKRAAAEHHPDRGGELERMQSLNAARDLLLRRGEN